MKLPAKSITHLFSLALSKPFPDKWMRGTDRPYIVFEYARYGSLNDQTNLSVKELARAMSHTLRGLQYLKSKQITHRDIKPENLLVSSRWPMMIKIADFDLITSKDIMKTLTGTADFHRPRALDGFFNGQYVYFCSRRMGCWRHFFCIQRLSWPPHTQVHTER